MPSMNTVRMLPQIPAMLAVHMEQMLFAFADGNNNLNVKAEGYNGGMWESRKVGIFDVAVLPEGRYTLINGNNYCEEECDHVTAGAALYVMAVSQVMYYMHDKNLSGCDDFVEYWEDLKYAVMDDKAIDSRVFNKFLD